MSFLSERDLRDMRLKMCFATVCRTAAQNNEEELESSLLEIMHNCLDPHSSREDRAIDACIERFTQTHPEIVKKAIDALPDREPDMVDVKGRFGEIYDRALAVKTEDQISLSYNDVSDKFWELKDQEVKDRSYYTAVFSTLETWMIVAPTYENFEELEKLQKQIMKSDDHPGKEPLELFLLRLKKHMISTKAFAGMMKFPVFSNGTNLKNDQPPSP